MKDIKHGGEYSRDWLLRAAEAEDRVPSFSVGGLAAEVGWLDVGSIAPASIFARFIELARRARNLTLESLAVRAEIDLAELVGITEARQQPTPRTVYRLSQVLDVSAENLMELAGLAEPRAELAQAALRFAARSEPTVELSEEERNALNEFVKVLVEKSDA